MPKVRMNQMKGKTLVLLLTICFSLGAAASVKAEVSYGEVYANAVADAMSRHNEMLNSGELPADVYNTIGYTLSDITGDGIDELVIRQVIDKHWAEYWVYGTDGSSSYRMGGFGCDATGSGGDLYGYREGILYEEAYKGSVSLGVAEWTGQGFSVQTLYEGTYDQNGTMPTIPDLYNYYDAGRLLEEMTGFQELTAGTVVQKSSTAPADDKFDLNRFAYRTVITDGPDDALVFQTEPYGDFMFDYQFWTGDQILVNTDWRQDGYAIAYQDGVYGYVDAGYIIWDNESTAPSQGNDLEWYRTYNRFTGDDGSVMEIQYDDYGHFDVIVNGERWFSFTRDNYRIGDSGAFEYIEGKNILSFYPGHYVGIYSRGNEDFYY